MLLLALACFQGSGATLAAIAATSACHPTAATAQLGHPLPLPSYASHQPSLATHTSHCCPASPLRCWRC